MIDQLILLLESWVYFSSIVSNFYEDIFKLEDNGLIKFWHVFQIKSLGIHVVILCLINNAFVL